ncbi:AraC family transcriptional regulator [Paenibacillus hodogayensis]|uniref:AraC family transcriptional regulator n=1 Tax=Paenibacillus hodogayensis TaxID=279208 RepID=A0ABV5W330_9BACL
MAFKYVTRMFMDAEFPFWIKKYRHDSDRIPHFHDFVELVYVEKGEAVHEFEGERYAIGPGDVFIINPGEVHTYRIRNGKTLDIVNCLFTPALIHESLLNELQLMTAMDFLYVLPFLNDRKRFHHRLRLTGRESATVLHLLESMIAEQEETCAGYRTLIKMKLVELLVLLSRYHKKQVNETFAGDTTDPGDDMRARRIGGYLERHSYQPIDVESIARLFHVSSRQLNRILKNETGMSVMETMHRNRMERAKQLLRETDETIIGVAALVGYESPSFFNRLFARQVGCSPSVYRSNAKANA